VIVLIAPRDNINLQAISNTFEIVSAYEVSKFITQMADKSSRLDVILTSLLKNINTVVSPLIGKHISRKRNVSHIVQIGTGCAYSIEGQASKKCAGELQDDFKPTNNLKDL